MVYGFIPAGWCTGANDHPSHTIQFRVLTGSWRKILITGNQRTEALASIKVEAMRVNSKVPTGTRVLPKPDR